jgi:hypothetical protein
MTDDSRHESPPVLRDHHGTWVRRGLIHVWQPAPPPDLRRRCRDCRAVIGPHKQLCTECRVVTRRASWRRNTNKRRAA